MGELLGAFPFRVEELDGSDWDEMAQKSFVFGRSDSILIVSDCVRLGMGIVGLFRWCFIHIRDDWKRFFFTLLSSCAWVGNETCW